VTLKIAMTLTLLLLLSSLIAVTTFIPLLQEGYGQNNNTQPQQQTSSQTTGAESASASSPINCKSIASQIGSTAFSIQNPNSEICDISIMRHSPQITDQNGTVLNKFLVANTLVEIMGQSSGNGGTGSNNTTQKVKGEFALLQTELKPVLNTLSKTNFTIVAIHNHEILENPKTIFVHWDAKGPLESIISPIKEVLAIQQLSAAQAEGGEEENPLAEIGEKLGEVFTGGGGNNSK
jgi:hypothetical protein